MKNKLDYLVENIREGKIRDCAAIGTFIGVGLGVLLNQDYNAPIIEGLENVASKMFLGAGYGYVLGAQIDTIIGMYKSLKGSK